MGIKDRFGTSGPAKELLKYFELTSEDIIKIIKAESNSQKLTKQENYVNIFVMTFQVINLNKEA